MVFTFDAIFYYGFIHWKYTRLFLILPFFDDQLRLRSFMFFWFSGYEHYVRTALLHSRVVTAIFHRKIHKFKIEVKTVRGFQEDNTKGKTSGNERKRAHSGKTKGYWGWNEWEEQQVVTFTWYLFGLIQQRINNLTAVIFRILFII